jgi:response regulator RpfG family c-di-GMP phosphodiesterase
MKVLLVYQQDRSDADEAARELESAEHAPRCVAAAELAPEGAAAPGADVVIVFSETYREKETYAVCQQLREHPAYGRTPLLVAVNMYQMPLANRVKALPQAHFIFAPFKAADVEGRVHMCTEPA